MKSRTWLVSLVVLLLLALLIAQELRFRWHWKALRAELQAVRTTEATVADPAAELPEAVRQLSQARSELATTQHRLAAALQQMNALQQQIQALSARRPGPRRAFEDRLPLDEPGPGGLGTPPGQPLRRSWGEEQATGAPDTPRAGDIPTAWAPRQPDGGEEWLQLEYSNVVQMAEVSVRESYNPGAIRKLVAVLPNGQEQVLWEGVTEPALAPVDTVFPVTGNVSARAVRLYLDTRRVPGWNEIDAVELVGRDGQRQWASQARASSSFADPR